MVFFDMVWEEKSKEERVRELDICRFVGNAN